MCTGPCCSCDCAREMAWCPFVYPDVPALVGPSDLRRIENVDISHTSTRVCEYNCSRVLGCQFDSFKLKLQTSLSLSQDEVSDKFRFVTFCLQFITYLIEFVLALIPDNRLVTLQKKGEVSSIPKIHCRRFRNNLLSLLLCYDCQKRQSPEESATFLSKMTWWWLNR